MSQIKADWIDFFDQVATAIILVCLIVAVGLFGWQLVMLFV